MGADARRGLVRDCQQSFWVRGGNGRTCDLKLAENDGTVMGPLMEGLARAAPAERAAVSCLALVGVPALLWIPYHCAHLDG